MPKRAVLGFGTYSVVYSKRHDGHACAAKVFGTRERLSDQAFDAEVAVYQLLDTEPALSGRIPKFYHVDKASRTIYMQHIHGLNLREALQQLTPQQLVQIQEDVTKTIGILHSHGICHGDVRLDNIFLPAILFDFSHAWIETSPLAREDKRWKHREEQDFAMLRQSFTEALQLQNTYKALDMIGGDIQDHSQQQKLADLLEVAEGTEPLLEKLMQIPKPDLNLAISISRIFRRHCQPDVALELLCSYQYSAPCDVQDHRSFIRFQAELAYAQERLHAGEAYEMYQNAIDHSVALLGKGDNYTVQLRVAYARCLEKSGETARALELLTTLISDLGSMGSTSTRIANLKSYSDKLRANMLAETFGGKWNQGRDGLGDAEWRRQRKQRVRLDRDKRTDKENQSAKVSGTNAESNCADV